MSMNVTKLSDCTPEEIEEKLKTLDKDSQLALLRVCGMLADCYGEGAELSAVIITKSGPVVGFALVNASMQEAHDLLDGAHTLFTEAMVGDIPPLGARH